MTAQDLRKDIHDMIERAMEDGLPLDEIYGVIAAAEQYAGLLYKASVIEGVKE